MTIRKIFIFTLFLLPKIFHVNITLAGNGELNLSKPPELLSLTEQASKLLESKEPAFGVGYANPFYSFDPLDSNVAGNALVTRLIYAQFFVNKDGKFESDIFDYRVDREKKKLILVLKRQPKYSDNTPLRIEDAALSIKRLVLSSPEMPVLRSIVGLQKWLKAPYPLLENLEGINISENTLTIDFSANIDTVIYRMFLPQLGIIPNRCVDKKKNKLNCLKPPFSGKFELVDSVLGNTKLYAPTFLKFKSQSLDYKDMWVFFVSANRIPNYIKLFHDQLVLVANECDLSSASLSNLADIPRVNSPRNHFYFLMLNDKSPSFQSKRVRQYFAMEFRKTLNKERPTSGSMFTNIMLGHQSIEELEKKIEPFSDSEIKTIVEHLRKNPPIWNHDGKTLIDPFNVGLYNTLSRHKIPFLEPEKIDFTKGWNDGKISIRPTYTNLSLYDHTGDAKRIFSHNSHPSYNFLTSAPLISKAAENLMYGDEKSHKNLNEILFDDSRFAVIAHYSRVYFTPQRKVKNIPFNIHSPEPYFFFKK